MCCSWNSYFMFLFLLQLLIQLLLWWLLYHNNRTRIWVNQCTITPRICDCCYYCLCWCCCCRCCYYCCYCFCCWCCLVLKPFKANQTLQFLFPYILLNEKLSFYNNIIYWFRLTTNNTVPIDTTSFTTTSVPTSYFEDFSP